MSDAQTVNIPLISPLIPEGVIPGTVFIVEYDPESQWFALATTMTAQYVLGGSRAQYLALARPREAVVRDLTKLGVDVAASETSGLLRVDDGYSATLAHEATKDVATVAVDDRYVRYCSLKVADMSLEFSRALKGQSASLSKWSTDQAKVLSVNESFSPFLRFNEDKAFLEWMENRAIPLQRKLGRVGLAGFVRDLHGESFYKRLENAVEGVIDVRVMEREDEARSYLRIRSFKGQPHDARWYEIEIRPNGEAVLKQTLRE